MTGTRPYRAWQNMKKRCDRVNCPDYPRYGGRGISYCEKTFKYAQENDNWMEDIDDHDLPLTLSEHIEVCIDTPELIGYKKEHSNCFLNALFLFIHCCITSSDCSLIIIKLY